MAHESDSAHKFMAASLEVSGHFVTRIAKEGKKPPTLLDLTPYGHFHLRQLRYVPYRFPESLSERAAWEATEVTVSYFSINF